VKTPGLKITVFARFVRECFSLSSVMLRIAFLSSVTIVSCAVPGLQRELPLLVATARGFWAPKVVNMGYHLDRSNELVKTFHSISPETSLGCLHLHDSTVMASLNMNLRMNVLDCNSALEKSLVTETVDKLVEGYLSSISAVKSLCNSDSLVCHSQQDKRQMSKQVKVIENLLESRKPVGKVVGANLQLLDLVTASQFHAVPKKKEILSFIYNQLTPFDLFTLARGLAASIIPLALASYQAYVSALRDSNSSAMRKAAVISGKGGPLAVRLYYAAKSKECISLSVFQMYAFRLNRAEVAFTTLLSVLLQTLPATASNVQMTTKASKIIHHRLAARNGVVNDELNKDQQKSVIRGDHVASRSIAKKLIHIERQRFADLSKVVELTEVILKSVAV